MSPKIKSAVVKTPQFPPKRRRMKKLHRDLLDQIEFYMSEANLRRDLFMREKAGERGTNDVPIQLFLSFPLIREMDVTEKIIVDVMENSTLLELSSDGKCLHRKLPVPQPPHNLDQSTLFMENIPFDATTEWLREVCQKIGNVQHVSLPRFKKTGLIKGLAFIEFSSPDEVMRACRIFNDPPKNFFPSRADKYLKRLDRLKYFLNPAEEQETPVTPVAAKANSTETTPSESVLNKSLDSAVDFERLGQDPGAPPSLPPAGRKRKRQRSRCASAAGSDLNKSEVTPTQTPAKKLKSLPTASDSTDSSGHDLNENKNSNENVSVSMETKRKRGRKVLFSITEDDNVRASPENPKVVIKTDNFCQKCGELPETDINHPKKQELLEEDDNNGPRYDVINGVPCDVKITIRRESVDKFCSHCDQNLNTPSRKSTVESQTEDSPKSLIKIKSKDDRLVLSGVKRRRSASEPSGTYDVGIKEEKRTKELSDQSDSEILSPVKQSMTLNVDELILQGRKKAAQEAVKLSDDVPVKRVMHSVIAKPTERKKPKKRRRKSKAQRKASKLIPPKLSVMPKIRWMELKEEYKDLQRKNMGKLKRTIRENKDAGSVFIKKHLDVLNDDDGGENTTNYDPEYREGSVKRSPEEQKAVKRGAPTFQPGVIVRISAIETTLDPSGELRPPKLPSIKEIKSRLNRYGQGVAYVDATPGDQEGFVRFNDGDSAQRAIMEERSLALCLLTGEHEEKYWERLLSSRARKFARERPKVRGRTKLLAKADVLVEKDKRSHIRFDNDFSV